MKDTECNLCGSKSFRVIYRTEDYPEYWWGSVVRCRRCNLVFRNVDYEVFSRKRLEGGCQPDYPNKVTPGRVATYIECAKRICEYRKLNRILDVGAGTGDFLRICLDNGWEAWGVELRPELARIIREKCGIHVAEGTLEDATYKGDSFDVVVFMNVIDYVKSPDRTLREAFRILRPGGAIFLRIPNGALHVFFRSKCVKFHRLWKKIRKFDHFVIHLYSFDRRTIFRYLDKSGFKDIRIENGAFSWAKDSKEKGRWRIAFSSKVGEVAQVIEILSQRRWLLAPSLSISGIKPY